MRRCSMKTFLTPINENLVSVVIEAYDMDREIMRFSASSSVRGRCASSLHDVEDAFGNTFSTKGQFYHAQCAVAQKDFHGTCGTCEDGHFSFPSRRCHLPDSKPYIVWGASMFLRLSPIDNDSRRAFLDFRHYQSCELWICLVLWCSQANTTTFGIHCPIVKFGLSAIGVIWWNPGSVYDVWASAC